MACIDKVEEFTEMANSLSSGYFKAHKAYGMMRQLDEIPAIMSDSIRLIAYLENCLIMEGFDAAGIEKLVRWIHKEL